MPLSRAIWTFLPFHFPLDIDSTYLVLTALLFFSYGYYWINISIFAYYKENVNFPSKKCVSVYNFASSPRNMYACGYIPKMHLENVGKGFTAHVEMLHVALKKTKAFFNLLCNMMQM